MIFIRDFSPFENNRSFHLMAFLDEAAGMSHLEFKIMRVRVRMESNFFDQCNVLMLLLEFLFLCYLILILAEIHQLAHWWIGIRYNLNKVESFADCQIVCFACRQDADLFPIIADNAYRWRFNLCVNPGSLLSNGRELLL